jgi:hypothetical protein
VFCLLYMRSLEVRFKLEQPLAQPLEEKTSWHPVDLELLWPKAQGQVEVQVTGYVLVSAGARPGVISDLDDTVVKSRATDLLKMVWIILVNNARTRLPFEGVADFYKALQVGTDGREFNPVFYVSSSPWNLYDPFRGLPRPERPSGWPAASQALGPSRDRPTAGAQDRGHSDAALDLSRPSIRAHRRLRAERSGHLPSDSA